MLELCLLHCNLNSLKYDIKVVRTEEKGNFSNKFEIGDEISGDWFISEKRSAITLKWTNIK